MPIARMINSAATTRMAMTFLRSLRHCRTSSAMSTASSKDGSR